LEGSFLPGRTFAEPTSTLSWLAARAYVTGVGSVQSTRSAQTGIGMLPVAVAQAYP